MSIRSTLDKLPAYNDLSRPSPGDAQTDSLSKKLNALSSERLEHQWEKLEYESLRRTSQREPVKKRRLKNSFQKSHPIGHIAQRDSVTSRRSPSGSTSSDLPSTPAEGTSAENPSLSSSERHNDRTLGSIGKKRELQADSAPPSGRRETEEPASTPEQSRLTTESGPRWNTITPVKPLNLEPPSSRTTNSEGSETKTRSDRTKAGHGRKSFKRTLMQITPRKFKLVKGDDSASPPDSPTLSKMSPRRMQMGDRDFRRQPPGDVLDSGTERIEQELRQAYDLRVRYRHVIRNGPDKGKLQPESQDGDLRTYFNSPKLDALLDAHVQATRIQVCSGPGTVTDQARQSLYQLIQELSAVILADQKKPEDMRQPGVIGSATALLDLLKQELQQLQKLPGALEALQKRYGPLPTGTRLIDAMALVDAPSHEIQMWIDNGFDLGHAARSAQGSLTLQELILAAGKRTNEKAIIERLLTARFLYPHAPKAAFLESAAEIIHRKVSVQTLQAMHALGIELHRDNLPDTQLGIEAELASCKPLGKGTMATVYLLEWGEEEAKQRWVYKEASDKAPDVAEIGGIPLRGSNLVGRIIATGKTAAELGIRSAPQAQAVMCTLPNSQRKAYGTLSQFVDGNMLESAPGATARLTLNRGGLRQVQTMDPARLTRLAERYGFKGYHIDTAGSSLNFLTVGAQTPAQAMSWDPVPETAFMRYLDFRSAPLLESLSNLGWLAGITAQLDMHPGNLMLTSGPTGETEVQTIDNDACAGKKSLSAMLDVGKPAEVTAQWEALLSALPRLANTADLPELPATIGREYRLELLTMTQPEFLSKYGQRLDTRQGAQAWARMQAVQAALDHKSNEAGKGGSPDTVIHQVDDWQPDTAGHVHAYGWPNVIGADLKMAILKLDATTVKKKLFGMLGQGEQDAAWSRVQEAQKRLRLPGVVAVVDDQAGWTSKDNLGRMGLDSQTLETAARELASAPDQWAVREVTRRYAIAHGVTGALALHQALATRQVAAAQGVDPVQTGFQGAALFHPKALMEELFPTLK